MRHSICICLCGVFLALSTHADPFRTVVGWDGDKNAVRVFLDGKFDIRHGEKVISLGFGASSIGKTFEWKSGRSKEGYFLPAFQSIFADNKFKVSITHFADRVEFGGNPYVVLYSRVVARNLTSTLQTFSPGAPSELTPLDASQSATLGPGAERTFDYALVVDDFDRGEDPAEWANGDELRNAGYFIRHFEHMEEFWVKRLHNIALIESPDKELDLAYQAGFIYIQIMKDGMEFHPGEFDYDVAYDHDSVGILSAMLTLGDFEQAPAELEAVPVFNMFLDAKAKHAWPYALYTLKTGDLAPAKKNWEKIKGAIHGVADVRTGPGGILEKSVAFDVKGFWLVDDWSALTGLLAYKFLAEKLGETDEAEWAQDVYNELGESTRKQIGRYMPTDKPSRILPEFTYAENLTRGKYPTDANWAGPFMFGRYTWDAWLMGADDTGINDFDLPTLIDTTYDWGFGILAGINYPPHNFGGYATKSNGYNAAYGAAGLRGSKYRSEGIHAYQYVLKELQSAPYAFWESILDSTATTPWQDGQLHPVDGGGSCPHAWGQAGASKVYLESLVAEFYDGKVLLGRGFPDEWLKKGNFVRVTNAPLSTGERADISFRASDDNEVEIEIKGTPGIISKTFYVDLPAFLSHKNVTSDAGDFDPRIGRLTLKPGTTHAVIKIN